jgi:hypothetical protein
MTNKKHCSGCDRDLDCDNFSWSDKAKGIRQRWCKECLRQANKAHYRNNSQIYKDRAIKRNTSIIAENRRRIHGYLSAHPCIDCGNTDVRCLEFDHVRGSKEADIGKLLATATPWDVIEAEIVKCEIRCANCHRIKTSEGRGWWRVLRSARK